MSFERSLKATLERSAETIEPDVASAYEVVTRRHGRSVRTRRLAYSAVALAAVTGIVLGLPKALDALRDQTIAPAGTPDQVTTSAYRRVSGTYTTRVPERAGLVRTYHLDGRWTMRLDESGEIEVHPPAGFVDVFGPPALGTFVLNGEQLTTNALYHSGLGCEQDGVYEWSFTKGRLVLDLVDDGCPYRSAVFATRWRETQGAL
jgi:hypothetical protein